MKKHTLRTMAVLLTVALLGLLTGCGQKPQARSSQEILEEMIVDYGSYGEEAEGRVGELLQELSAVDADAAARWETIMNIWKTADSGLPELQLAAAQDEIVSPTYHFDVTQVR